MEKLSKNFKPNKTLAAVCGLYCPACSLFIGTHEDPKRLERMAAGFGRSVEELTCNGCRSDTRCFYCRETCAMKPCAEKKGVDFCSECDEFPCNTLKTFQAEAPHRRELWNSFKDIKEKGVDAWACDMAALYACPKCEVLNSAYDLQCRNCGASPSSEFNRRHGEAVRLHISKR